MFRSIQLNKLFRYSSFGLSSTSSRSIYRIPFRTYDKRVVDHFNNPHNAGSLNKNDINVGTGLVGAPACGDVLKLQIKVDDKGRIIDSKFKTFGCASAISSSNYAADVIKGKTLDEAVTLSNKDIASFLKLSPVKLHCSMLAEEAVKSAVQNLKEKQKQKAKENELKTPDVIHL